MNPIRYFRWVACPLMVTTVAVLWAAPNLQWTSAYAMHTYFNNRFLESAGRGVGRMMAIGMQVDDSMRLRTTSNGAYKLESVELVGVAMHDKPVAFSAAAHNIARYLQPRPLTAFEERALVELTAGETVAVNTT